MGTGKIKLGPQGLGKKGPSPFARFTLRSGRGRFALRIGKEQVSKGHSVAMQEITALEQRIAAALDRIGKGLDRPSAAPRSPTLTGLPVDAPHDGAAVAALRAQLDEERALTSRLQKQLRVSKEREAKGDTQDKIDRLTQELDVQGLELQRMRRVNTALVQQVETLREAQMSGLAEPQMINKSMVVELDALRALRLTEMAEMDEILAALEPHLTEAGNART